MTGYAFFVERPRTIDDLVQPHPLESERTFTIVKTIALDGIDYENFTTDMLADRYFLEKNASLCGKAPEEIRCLLVKHRKTGEGVLVVPRGAWVDMAALFPQDNESTGR